MLASLRGTVLLHNDFTAVVECGGFGIELQLSGAASALCRPGKEVFLHTFLQVSDAGMALYGFADEREKSCFRLLLLTKGVGGKMALSVLQSLSPAEIVSAVERNDAKLLTTVPGIGKKTAERICFELADRIHSSGFELLAESLSTPESGGLNDGQNAGAVLDALESLGFDRASAMRALKTVTAEQGSSLDESSAIMACLRLLQPHR